MTAMLCRSLRSSLTSSSAGVYSKCPIACATSSASGDASTTTDYNNDPSLADIQVLRQRHLGPLVRHTAYRRPPLLERGHMQWLYDSAGKRYLDLFGGIVTVSVGHCHPRVNAALRQQADRLWHTTATYLHPAVHVYAQRLAATMPPGSQLSAVYPVNSGSEANDLAMLLARVHTGHFDVVSLRNGYHGMSPYTMGMAATAAWQFALPGSRSGVQHAVNPDPFRGRWGGAHCRDSLQQTCRPCDCRPVLECDDYSSNATVGGATVDRYRCAAEDEYVHELEELFAHSMAGQCAAMFVEPIQGVGGVVQYPHGYVRRASELVRARGGLMVADEVQTGFGRTGDHFWGFQSHAGFQPDIVTMAKGIANGFPMGAVVTTPAIAAALTRALHFNTFGGSPLASRVATAVLDVIAEEQLQENCRRIGAHMMAGLGQLRDRYEVIGDVRGKGLMIGIEMVLDKESRRPLDDRRFADMWERCKDDGVLLGRGGANKNVFRITPPMCVSRADADHALDVFERAIRECVDK